ncbi:MAG: hypothetical protein LBS50_00455 [Prevotellaceae bacterium]|jgi:hypothetical protein|nr:hypothetical protein [Prevotellaceae bacterium]
MKKANKSISLFSAKTLDSLAMAELVGGADTKTYCSGAKCNNCSDTVCGTKVYKCSGLTIDTAHLLTLPIVEINDSATNLLK